MVFFFWPRWAACRILVPRPGIEPRLSAVKAHRVITTELPGNSHPLSHSDCTLGQLLDNKMPSPGTSLPVQQLRLHSSNAEGKGLLSGWGTKSPHASQHKCVLNRFSCVRLCDPMNCSLPGSSVQGILQARILEWVAIPSSRGSSQPRVRTHISYISCTGRWVLYHLCHLRSLNKIK